MKTLNKSATKTFFKIIEGEEGYKKIDNSKGFMALVVEKLRTDDVGSIYSLAHYFEQNGDLCKDPDMEFMVRGGSVIPMTFQQDIPPVYSEGVFYDNGWKVRNKVQADITSFANMWIKNIKHQQGL